jgi:hypothetical protein
VFLTVDTSLGWFYRDKVFKSQPSRPIRILDETKRTLAGVKIPSFDQPIRDPGLRQEVSDALRKLFFHVKFEKPMTGNQWELSMS